MSCDIDGAVSESLDERCHVTQTGQSMSHWMKEVSCHTDGAVSESLDERCHVT